MLHVVFLDDNKHHSKTQWHSGTSQKTRIFRDVIHLHRSIMGEESGNKFFFTAVNIKGWLHIKGQK